MGDLLVSRFRVPSRRKRPKQRPAREAHAGLAVRYAIRPKESTFLADARYRTGRPPPTPACLHVAWKDLVSVGSTRYVCARVERRTTPRGEVAEWLNAPHSKCGILARVSGVRIPPSPPATPSTSAVRCGRHVLSPAHPTQRLLSLAEDSIGQKRRRAAGSLAGLKVASISLGA